jgi:hypothetical protein
MFGTHMLRIDISSWWIFKINIKWPSLSILTDFSLKSTLSNVSKDTPAYLWGLFICLENLFPCFDSKPVFVFFSVSCVPCKQHMVGSCFLMQFAILCLLVEVLRPLTFTVSVERCVEFPVIFITALFTLAKL